MKLIQVWKNNYWVNYPFKVFFYRNLDKNIHIYFQDNWTPLAELYSTCNKMRPCDNNAAYKRLKC